MLNKDYIKSKLFKKINQHLSMHGWSTYKCSDEICEKISDIGMYKIHWNNKKVTDVTKIDDKYNIEVLSGKYYVMYRGSYVEQLYSSEFIEFTKKENREYQLNKLLKK